MTMPRRKRRTISVNDQTYYWRTSLFDSTWEEYDAGHIFLTIEAADFPGKRALAVLTPRDAGEVARPQGIYSPTAIVKPALVRQILLAALEQGWTPAFAPNDIAIPGYEGMLPRFYPFPSPGDVSHRQGRKTVTTK